MTPRQVETLDFVRERIAVVGVAPSVREVAEHLDLASPASAKRLLDGLVEQGRLRRTGTKVRGLDLGEMPDLRSAPTDALRAELSRRGEALDALDAPRMTPVERYRSCAADTCGSSVKLGHLFCRPHWFALPDELRVAIFAAHRARDVSQYQELVARARDIADGCGGAF